LGNGLATLSSTWASTHAAVVFTSAVGQCLGLTGVASASGVCFAFDFVFHQITYIFNLLFSVDTLLGFGIGLPIKIHLNLVYRHSCRPVRPRLVSAVGTWQ
jgi:hypothetical protein